MSEDIKQHLSALMDGELDRDATRFLLRRLDGDAALRATWSRYHLIREGLRRQQGIWPAAGFSEAVLARLDAEPLPRGRALGRWARYAAGGTIAAGVAVAALLVSLPVDTPRPDAGQPVAAESRPALPTDTFLQPRGPMLAQPAAATTGGDAYASTGGLDPRLQSYLIRHYEASGAAGRSGIAPYVLLVAPTRAPETRGANADGVAPATVHPRAQ